LHIHSHFSDGSETPEAIVARAKQNGLAAIALTDHDTVAGVLPAQEVCAEYEIEVIPGIEFSTEVEGKDIHILGYCFDIRHPELLERVSLFQRVRRERIEQMIAKLKQLGVDNITVDEVCALTQSGAVGRPHLAALLQKKGWVKDFNEAFEKYLSEDAVAYVAKYQQTPTEAIELIRRAGGVAVLAHPMITNKDELIPQLVAAGLGGIEVCYPNCSSSIMEYYQKLAAKHGLAMTGGSDSHGELRSYNYVGKVRIPYEWVEELRMRAK
jgi:hypothetical protein